MKARQQGFSLLEVIVAVAILGLGLTTILSAQAGLFASSSRGANMTRAANLARCKMSEVEVGLSRDGYPLTDQKDEGHCCEHEDDNGFLCNWIVETIKLPELNALDGGTPDGGTPGLSGGMGLKLDGGLDLSSGSGMSGLSALGAGLPGLGSSSSGSGKGLGAAAGGLDAIASMALTMVYPTVKPMLEASIRRITIKISWYEGINERTLEIGQYVTNPQQGGMLPGMPGYDPAAAMQGMMGLPGAATGTNSTPASGMGQSGNATPGMSPASPGSK
jgi:general secretion pathway protein I